jgi:hypothetical protein
MRARRLEIIDQVVEGDESVVLVGHTVIRLSPLATALLAELEEWTASSALTAAMTDVFGPPPEGTDAVAAVEAALMDMAGQGLIEHD